MRDGVRPREKHCILEGTAVEPSPHSPTQGSSSPSRVLSGALGRRCGLCFFIFEVVSVEAVWMLW